MLVRRTIASHRVLRLQSDTFGSGLLRVAPEHSNLDSRLVLPPGHYSARQCQRRTADGVQQNACAASGSQRRRLQFALVTLPEQKSRAPKPPQNFRASDRVRSTGLNTMREIAFALAGPLPTSLDKHCRPFVWRTALWLVLSTWPHQRLSNWRNGLSSRMRRDIGFSETGD